MPQARTHIAVVRSDGRAFANMDVAFRALAGTPQEITHAERRNIRAALRGGRDNVRDHHGFRWSMASNATPTVQRAVATALAADPMTLTFGVELEVVAGPDVPQGERVSQLHALLSAAGFSPRWRAVRDGSVVNGGEVVSPVLQGESGLAELAAVCDLLKSKGWTAVQSCGMHVHVGVRQFTVSRVADLCRLFQANEGHFDSVVARSRRDSNSHFCQSVIGYRIPAQTPSTMPELARHFNGGWNGQSHYGSFRYRKLNLQSFAFHGTVEFRQHQGTVEAARATGWVRLVLGFAAAGLNGERGAMSFDDFATKAGSAAGFIHSRRAHFSRSTAQAAA